MKFVIILYYCLSTNCYTVVYPELYWGRKDCSAAATEIKNQYRTLEEIDKKVSIGSVCIESDLTWMRIPI